MLLRSVETADLDLLASWLGAEENYRWLEFGGGRQKLSPIQVKMMVHGDSNFLRLYTADDDCSPAGIVALSDLNPAFRTAMLWYVLGDKRFRRRGLTARAVSMLLRVAFDELPLGAVNAWTVDGNVGSVRVLERNRFRRVGRLRQAHYVDGKAYDRLLFDLLASEYRAL